MSRFLVYPMHDSITFDSFDGSRSLFSLFSCCRFCIRFRTVQARGSPSPPGEILWLSRYPWMDSSILPLEVSKPDPQPVLEGRLGSVRFQPGSRRSFDRIVRRFPPFEPFLSTGSGGSVGGNRAESSRHFQRDIEAKETSANAWKGAIGDGHRANGRVRMSGTGAADLQRGGEPQERARMREEGTRRRIRGATPKTRRTQEMKLTPVDTPTMDSVDGNETSGRVVLRNESVP